MVFPILLVALFAVVGVIVAVLGARAERERRERLAAWAASRGWSFDPEHDPDHDEQFRHFPVFCQGHSRRAFNTIRGHFEIEGRPYPVKAGDYLYKVTRNTGKSRSTTTYRFSYVILTLPFAGVPGLEIRREGLFDKLTQVLGFDDIDFESEEFSRRFCVTSSEKKFAYDVVSPKMMEFLLGHEPPAIRIERGQICLNEMGCTWEPQEFEGQLAWAQSFFGLWPDYLLSDLESRTGVRRSL